MHAASLFSAGESQTLEQVKCLAELVIVVLGARLAGGLAAAGAISTSIAVAQVAGQIGFAKTIGSLLAGQLGAGHFDVRLDALGLDGAAVGRVVERSGELERAVVVKWQHGLYRALAEAVGTHYHRSFLVLQGAGDTLRSRGAAAVDQHDHGYAFTGVRRIGIEAQLGIGDAALGVDDQALLEEMVGDLYRGLQHAAGVVAQVQDQAVEFLAVFLAQSCQCLAHLRAGVDLELGDTQVAIAWFEQLALDAGDLDDCARQFDVEGLAALAHQRQVDFAAWLAAHHPHSLDHRQALGRFAVDLDDQVASLDAGSGCGSVIDGRNHLDKAVLDTDFDAQATELPAGAFLQLGEGFRLKIGRVRVEIAQHALDGI